MKLKLKKMKKEINNIKYKDKYRQFRNSNVKINKEDLKTYFDNDRVKNFEVPKS